jgi:selenocysteine-specific elongation factor
VLAICERDGRATIAGVRDELGTSRRYAQALLEHLDAEKLTRRVGDAHVLRRR